MSVRERVCVGHLLRAVPDEDDGVDAFDHVRRVAMVRKLRESKAAAILRFVRLFYGTQSTYLWQGDKAQMHHIHQG